MSTANGTHSPTLAEFLRLGAQRWPDQPWCRTPAGESSRREAVEAGLRVAAGLARRDVRPGEHVIVVLPNSLDFVHAFFGSVFARAVTVAVNPRAAGTELPAVEQEIRPKVIIAADGARDLPAEADIVALADLLAEDPLDWSAVGGAAPEDPVSFIQSSGSTGRPKFVIETNRMYTMAAEGYPFWLGLDADDVLLTTLPLSHLNAQVYSLLGSFGCGAQLALLPRFSASTFWDYVERYGATQFNAIGAMVEALMSRERTAAEVRNKVRICYSAPAPPTDRHREIEDRFGLRLVIGYALSESPYGLIVPVDEPVVPESMGVPRQHPVLGTVNQARLVDAAGDVVGDGVRGELELRNPAISPGYFGNAEESARILHDDWLRTGDLAIRDAEGHYHFAGRVKEMIRHKGENLSPVEVENVLEAHPGVTASAVIGVPSPMSEEDVKAFVVLAADADVTAEDLGRWCADRLPPYKAPRYIELVDRLPLTETQKVAKKQLPRERTENETDLVSR
ncbi:MAG: AMP-binding protein [Haloechinothrix sp.]